MNERQQTILTCLIDHFIDSCQPISSTMVKDRLEIQLSPASVRQVFSVLDQNGYISKLHTSSGRVPTNKGYRAYVDQIQLPNAFTLDSHVDEQTYYDKFRFLFDQFLVRLSQQIPYVTILKINHQELSDLASIQYVSLSSSHGLLLLFHTVGVVSKVLVTFPMDVSQLDCEALTSWVKTNLNQSVDDDLLHHQFNHDEVEFIKTIRKSLLCSDDIVVNNQNIIIKNIRRCLSLVDYATREDVEKILDILEDKQQIATLVDSAICTSNISISIGNELNDDRLNGSSLVAIPITLDGVLIASLGILGPTRMDYSKITQFFSSNQSLAELIQF